MRELRLWLRKLQLRLQQRLWLRKLQLWMRLQQRLRLQRLLLLNGPAGRDASPARQHPALTIGNPPAPAR